MLIDDQGICDSARVVLSPNCDERPAGSAVELLVIHHISLPPDQYGGPGVEQLFSNTLDPAAHPYYAGIAHLRVSSHFFIRRDGELLQFVPTGRRAWHAGVSSWRGRERCNDFSLGVELEGNETDPYTDAQYARLTELVHALRRRYPSLTEMSGHEHIAPGRKRDPGPTFDWGRLADCALPLWRGEAAD